MLGIIRGSNTRFLGHSNLGGVAWKQTLQPCLVYKKRCQAVVPQAPPYTSSSRDPACEEGSSLLSWEMAAAASEHSAAAAAAGASQSTVQQQQGPGTGSLELIMGPMFAGKTNELIKRVRQHRSNGKEVLLLKSNKDTRYTAAHVSSHSGERLACQEAAK